MTYYKKTEVYISFASLVEMSQNYTQNIQQFSWWWATDYK